MKSRKEGAVDVREVENGCVGCPQGCIQCGRDKEYIVFKCDCCGDYIDDEEDVMELDGKDYCESCYEEILRNEDDIDDA